MAGYFDPDESSTRDAQRADAQRAAQEAADNDLRFVMSDARGRSFVWQLLADAGIYRTSFASDPLVMAHNEGKRDAGLRLLNRIMRVTPAQYLKTQEEHTNGHS